MLLRITHHGPSPGDRLMDEDFALVQRAARGEIGPTLRFYTWSEPTISLGYHQSAGVLDAVRMRSAGMPWVQRPTGGAAVLHSDELTYAIVAPLPDAGGGKRLQRYVSAAISDGLRAVGVPADVDERGEPLTALPNRTSCFVRTSRWEVTAGGRKLVGSAQRKFGDAYLQHGSILIGDDHLRIVDYLAMDREAEREGLKEKLRARSTTVAEQLSSRIEAGPLSEALADAFRRRYSMLFEDSPRLSVLP